MTALVVFSQPLVFSDSLLECLTLAILLSAMVGVYRHLECNKDGCHKLGRFRHGHLKLCRLHHPLVPDDGKITSEHIDAVSKG